MDKHRTRAWESGLGKLLTLSQPDLACPATGGTPPCPLHRRGEQEERGSPDVPEEISCKMPDVISAIAVGQSRFTGGKISSSHL